MNEKLGMQDLIDILARKHGLTRKEAEGFVKEFFQLIEESLEADKYVKVRGLGTFKLISVDSRESVKVNTGERFQIEGHTKVAFTPEPTLRDIINRPFSHFETVVLNEGTVLDDTPLDRDEEEEETSEVPVAVAPEPVALPQEPLEETKEPLEAAKEPLEEANEPLEETNEPLEASNKPVEMSKTPVSIEESRKDSTSMRYFIGIVIVVVLLCAGAVAFLYFPDLLKRDNPTPIPENKPVVESKAPEKPVVEPAKPAPKQLIPKKDAPMPPDNGRSFKPDSTSYRIVGTEFTYKLGKGEMLTKVALRFYGTKKLWPYLVEHNRDIIKNPNSVPSGITLKIPRLEKIE